MTDSSGTVAARFEEPWGLLMSLWLLLVFIGAYAIVPASALPVVTEGTDIGLAAASWIVTAPPVGAAIAGLPIGAWLDRTDNRRAIVLAGLWLFVVGLLAWVAGTEELYWPLVATRLLGGVALVTAWVAGINLLSAGFTDRYRTTVVAAYAAGYPAGYALGQFGAPIVTARLGWPATFPVFGALAAGTLPACYLAGRGIDRPASEGDATLRGAASVLANRDVQVVCVLSFVAYAVYLILNSWLPTYLVAVFGLSLAESGLFVASVPAIGIAARTSGGLLADRAFARRQRPVVVLSFAATTLVVAALAVLGRIGTLVPFLLGLAAAGFGIQLQIGVLYTYVQGFVAEETIGTAVALVAVVGWIGQFVAPALTGALVDRTGNHGVVLVCAAAFAFFGIGIAWFAPDP